MLCICIRIELFLNKNPMLRRSFLKSATLALIPGNAYLPGLQKSKNPITRLALSLNAYSFNHLLLNGKMTIEDLFKFAMETGFHGVDLTAYYIPGYPEVPGDKELFEIKKRAFRTGMAISGTGVRNNFTLTDPDNLQKEIKLVKFWIQAASKLGAPHVRVFAGRSSHAAGERERIKSRIIESFRECARFASDYGVMVAFQNHNDFIVTADEVIEIMEVVDSEWFGLMLDIGSLPAPDPYRDIERLIPYAVSWQVKEHVLTEKGPVPTNFDRLLKIVFRCGYHGYFPLETLGEGDPVEKVKTLYGRVTAAMV